MLKWIEKKTGESVGSDLQEGLKSGVALCKLMNTITPGAIPKINSSSMAFKQVRHTLKKFIWKKEKEGTWKIVFCFYFVGRQERKKERNIYLVVCVY